MHAAFPRFTNEIDQVMKHGFNTSKASVFLDRVGGKLVAKGMAERIVDYLKTVEI